MERRGPLAGLARRAADRARRGTGARRGPARSPTTASAPGRCTRPTSGGPARTAEIIAGAPRRPGADPTPGSASATAASGQGRTSDEIDERWPGHARHVAARRARRRRRAARTTRRVLARFDAALVARARARRHRDARDRHAPRHRCARSRRAPASTSHALIPNLGGFWFDVAADGTLCDPVAVDTLPDDDERARSRSSCLLVLVRRCWARRAAAPRAASPTDTRRAGGDDDDHTGDQAAPFALTSTAFENNGAIPPQYACDGAAQIPPLAWNGVPADATSLALIVHDPDAPITGGFTHWVVGGLSPTDGQLPPVPAGAREIVSWRPPCPPPGDRAPLSLHALRAEPRRGDADAIPAPRSRRPRSSARTAGKSGARPA